MDSGIGELTEPAGLAPRSVSELVAVQASAIPGAPAILAPAREPLSHGALREAVRDTVRFLRARGVQRGDRVALILPPGPDAATAFAGVASAAACAPLNPAYRRAELEFYFSDLRPRVVVVGAELDSPARDVARALDIPVVDLIAREHEPAGRFRLESLAGARPVFDDPAGADDVALVLHTSGTTARPKMVALTHANLCVSARNVAAALRLGQDDRCLNVMPLFHIHGIVAAVLASLASGGSVICTPGFLAPRFFEWVDELSPTWYTAVPTIHQAILARAATCGDVIARARLRFARSSSSALSPIVQTELERALGVPVIEAYGMTEAAHQMASNPLPPRERRPGSVGTAAGPEIVILDEVGTVLPGGTVGEVSIRGDNVFSGYEGNPEANAAAFTNGWFRTGDEGYIDADGYLYLRGRIKEIINRAGEKIAPREIDEVLLAHPDIVQAVAFAVPDPRLGEDVGAAVVVRDGADATEEDLQEFVATRLASFKVPRVIRLVEEIPKGPTGKLQRIGLAERLGLTGGDIAAGAAGGGDRAARSALERELAVLWSEILGLERVGVADDFFALGGDSVLGAKLLVTLRERYPGGHLPLTALVRAPTVERMAELIENAEPEAPEPSLVAIQASGSCAPFYFVHSLDGVVIRFAGLARRLGPEQPFYGLQARGVNGLGEPHELVEEMAADYLAEIRALQPRGPYLLGGVCMGGPVALEMARTLLDEGERVALLALVDPRGEPVRAVSHYLRRARWHRTRGQLLRATGRRAVRAVRGTAERGTVDGVPQDEAFLRRMEAVRDRYAISPYPGSAIVLACADYATPPSFWAGQIRGELTWHELPGPHIAVFRPPAVDRLAEVLGPALLDVQRGEGGR